MAKTRQTREPAKTFVSPLFAWNNAVLKGGEMMLDSMATAAKSARDVRVAVLDADAPPRKSKKAKAGARRAKRRRR